MSFSDVEPEAWYYESVAAAYELGLMEGTSTGLFSPDSSLTVAEAITLACRILCIYRDEVYNFTGGDTWYQPYVDYAVNMGMMSEYSFDDYTAPATRAEVASLFGKFPEQMLTQINQIQSFSIPGVWEDDACYGMIYRLYAAGIFTGSDTSGAFHPDDQIKRSEIAAIITRIAIPELRKSTTLTTEYVTVYSDNGEEWLVPAWGLDWCLSAGWKTEPFTVPENASVEEKLNSASLRPIKTNCVPLDRLIDKIFAQILKEDMTTYQKTKACYDYLIENVDYGYNTDWGMKYPGLGNLLFYGDLYDRSCADCQYVYFALEVLETGIGVCDDYSAAFLVMTRRIGLSSYACYGVVPMADGSGDSGHVWNTITLGGKDYAFDAEVEDKIANGGTPTSYRFCREFGALTSYRDYDIEYGKSLFGGFIPSP